MRTNRIIFVFPPANFLSCLLEIVEPVQIKTFIPEFPIEAFNETILHGFPGIDKHMLYLLLIGPCIEGNTFPRNFINQGEYAEPSASGGNITDKVH